MPKSQQSWARSQHPPTQWNLRGGRWSSVENSTKKIPKIPPVKFISFSRRAWSSWWGTGRRRGGRRESSATPPSWTNSTNFIQRYHIPYSQTPIVPHQGVTKRFLSLLTSSALVYESKYGGREGVAGSQPMRTAVHITWHGAQINFRDLPPYLTYVPHPSDE